jgi:hypothetical protein
LGIGDWAQSPIPNPQSPIPNPQRNNLFPTKLILNKNNNKYNLIYMYDFNLLPIFNPSLRSG